MLISLLTLLISSFCLFAQTTLLLQNTIVIDRDQLKVVDTNSKSSSSSGVGPGANFDSKSIRPSYSEEFLYYLAKYAQYKPVKNPTRPVKPSATVAQYRDLLIALTSDRPLSEGGCKSDAVFYQELATQTFKNGKPLTGIDLLNAITDYLFRYPGCFDVDQLEVLINMLSPGSTRNSFLEGLLQNLDYDFSVEEVIRLCQSHSNPKLCRRNYVRNHQDELSVEDMVQLLHDDPLALAEFVHSYLLDHFRHLTDEQIVAYCMLTGDIEQAMACAQVLLNALHPQTASERCSVWNVSSYDTCLRRARDLVRRWSGTISNILDWLDPRDEIYAYIVDQICKQAGELEPECRLAALDGATPQELIENFIRRQVEERL